MHAGPRFGIEEEYFITDLASRVMVGQPCRGAIQACRDALGEHFAFEMFQGQIEVASPIFTTLGQATDYLAGAREAVSRSLQPYGLSAISVGSHPLADWRTQMPTDKEHFQQIFRNYGHVAHRSVLSGLHVHVEVPDPVDRVHVMNEVLPWTPLLLALSCSSPFWDGADSGFMSFRQTLCDEWPRMGIPPLFAGQHDYDVHIALLTRTGIIKRPSECWWALRPCARFPTLELRMTDACPRLADALTLASLYRLLIAYALEQKRPGASYTPTSRILLEENRWRAKRSGLQGAFLIEGHEQTFSIAQWLEHAEQVMGSTAERMQMHDIFDQVREMIAAGTSADRQQKIFRQGLNDRLPTPLALAQVVDHLLQET
ncbi:carboxylate-amine ligase [Pseudomonas sp. B2M1-30]|uniref:carboxylate-amine ligase n=1 Tax=Pseudomonas TaxID=286 RepID=UPI0021C796F6|nr:MULTISPECIES: carboxylate-amine ligase [Pseudomonas]MCU0117770.1 carboxylate-amine ligase [Pseudomonas sp. B2M1-30]MCU7259306.1 carboxylate-amine ligase [Pseudomonas koreensis]